MKNFMKLLILALSLTMASQSFAQTFGVKAGLNLSKVQIHGATKKYIKISPGFNLGATAEFPITGIFSFETGLFLTTKGYKMKVETPDEHGTGKVNLYYLEIPLTGKALFDIGSINIYGTFGPYIGMGITGKVKTESTYLGVTEKTNDNIKWGTDKETDQLKRLDYGLVIGTGVEFKSFQIGLSYDLGLANISTQSDHKLTNQVLGISVGCKFGGK